MANFNLKEKEDKKRNAVIVYSGGDDLFIVGSWDDIIGFAVDLYYALKKYTQGTLKISGGIAYILQNIQYLLWQSKQAN